MWRLFLLAFCLFAAMNWFVLPNSPTLQHYIDPLTIWSALGLSALCVAFNLLFGDGK